MSYSIGATVHEFEKKIASLERERDEARASSKAALETQYRIVDATWKRAEAAEAELAALRQEVDEALQLTESCSTLRQMSASCIEGAFNAAALAALKARVDLITAAAGPLMVASASFADVREDLRGGTINVQMTIAQVLEITAALAGADAEGGE